MGDDRRESILRERARLKAEAEADAAKAAQSAAKLAAVERDLAEFDRMDKTYWSTALTDDATLTPPAASAPPSSLKDGRHGFTVRNLSDHYRTDPRSPYSKVEPITVENYDRVIKRLLASCGHEKVADLNSQKINGYFSQWSHGHTKIAIARASIQMLRSLAHFGMNELQDADCQNLSTVLHSLRFPTATARSLPHMTADHVDAIRRTAHEFGRPSIALAQAIQFACEMKQADVIGVWAPVSVLQKSAIIQGNFKWIRGIRWNEISEDWMLKHTYNGKVTERRFTDYPIVMEEFGKYVGTRSGPVIVNEHTGLPYERDQFRDDWRKIANAAGVPKSVRNADSRPRKNRGAGRPSNNEAPAGKPSSAS